MCLVFLLAYAGKRHVENVQDPGGHVRGLHDDAGGPLPLRRGVPQQPARRRRSAVHAHPALHPRPGCRSSPRQLPTSTRTASFSVFMFEFYYVVIVLPRVQLYLTLAPPSPFVS